MSVARHLKRSRDRASKRITCCCASGDGVTSVYVFVAGAVNQRVVAARSKVNLAYTNTHPQHCYKNACSFVENVEQFGPEVWEC